MGHTLVLEVSEEVYGPLLKRAEQLGSTPEKLAIEWLETLIRGPVDDPIENFIGAFDSNISDWADEHDTYLGQHLTEALSGIEEDAG
jgi:hypothetical protein